MALVFNGRLLVDGFWRSQCLARHSCTWRHEAASSLWSYILMRISHKAWEDHTSTTDATLAYRHRVSRPAVSSSLGYRSNPMLTAHTAADPGRHVTWMKTARPLIFSHGNSDHVGKLGHSWEEDRQQALCAIFITIDPTRVILMKGEALHYTFHLGFACGWRSYYTIHFHH